LSLTGYRRDSDGSVQDVSESNPLPIKISSTSSNSSVYLTNSGGTNISTPTLADNVTNASNPLATADFNLLYSGSTWNRWTSLNGASAGTGVGVGAVANTPTSSINQGIALSATTVAASSLVLKASAGNLFGVTVNAGASAGYLMIFNATSAPADGTVTPIWSMPVAANAGLAFSFDIPVYCSTGITAVFSTTGPFTKTASATAFISGMVK
jgi:hypothetical protein